MDEAIDQIAKAAEDVRAASRILANPSGTAGVTANLNASALFLGSLLYEPWAAGADLSTRGKPQEAFMTHWHDTMVDRPESDGAVYATGWTISGLAVLGTVIAVWILGI